MSVIIRLQNLPWSANALDIRQFFHGLSIPEGGVHIVGGELGDAFIAFSTDEDARQAFERNNGKIKEVQIKLMLSSRTEMQKVIEAARSQTMAPYLAPTPVVNVPPPVPLPAPVPQITPQSNSKKDDTDSDRDRSDKRDRRRSRSRSRDRSERSRDRDRRDRRRRDRSRSRSRDRRDRRRRDRSYSRERHRSRDRDHKSSGGRRRSNEKSSPPSSTHNQKDTKINVWEHQNTQEPTPPTLPPVLPFNTLDVALRNVASVASVANVTSVAAAAAQPPLNNPFPSTFDNIRRDNWLLNTPTLNTNNINNRFSENSLSFSRPPERPVLNMNDRFHFNRPNNNMNFNENGNRYSRNWETEDRLFNGRLDALRDRRRENGSNCCVRLHPYYGGFGDIRRFFSGLFIHNSGIKLLNDKTGKRTGWVYVRFVYPEGKEDALSRTGGSIRNQQVEVMHLDDEEFDKEIDRYQPPDNVEIVPDDEDDDVEIVSTTNFNSKNVDNLNATPQKYTCLVVEDLPTYVKEQDILKMFSDYSLMSIIIIESRRQRKSLVAYVKFSNFEHAKKACEETIRHSLDGKQLKVKPCSDVEYDTVNRQQNEFLDTDDGHKFVKVESQYVSLIGLPSNVNERDITDFFCDVGIVPDKVHLVTDEVGFTGKAYCEFVSLDEAQSAVAKDGMYLGAGIITVKSVSRAEIDDAIGFRPSQPHMNNMNYLNSNPRPYFRNNFGMMNPRIPDFMGPRPMMRFQPPPKENYLGPPGCIVLMENVPYKAELDEILDFFCDFDIPADNVLRRYNANGQPSGETKIIFDNPEDAQRAVQKRNREKIRDRVVYLSLC